MSDIDFYIIQFAPEVQHRLMRIRSIELDAFPDHAIDIDVSSFPISTISPAGA